MPLKEQTIFLAASVILLGAAGSSNAQTDATSAATANVASSGQPLTKAEQKKLLKEQRKAARKEARAKNSAELKRLESTGYKPVMNDPNYPESIQKAQQKAAESAASQ